MDTRPFPAVSYDARENRVSERNTGRGYILRKYERKANRLLTALLAGWALFQLIFSVLGTMDAVTFRGWHGMFLLAFGFAYYPARRGDETALRRPPWYDLLLIACVLAVYGWFALRYVGVAMAGGALDAAEHIAAALGIALLMEAARRTAPGLMWLALAFLAYSFLGRFLPGALGHSGVTVKRLLRHLFWGSQGIFGVGAGVSAGYVFLFMIFGAFLRRSGFSQFLNDLALAMVGCYAGGPAKVAVVASALLGMMNGSAVANVATTGAITIPMMKKNGYSAEFAGAVEAVASTGGQFMPPVMGAVGFLMAEYLGVSYTKVAIAAAVPAVLYYLALFLSLHFEAKRLGLSGISRENLPRAGEVLKKGWHLLLPLLLLIGMMLAGFTPLLAAVCATIAVPLAAALRRETRMSLRAAYESLAEGARSAVSVGITCMLIGVLVGTVSLTGLGLRLSEAIMRLSDFGGLYAAALLSAVLCTVLGMGVPGVAAYVIVASVVAPTLVEAGAAPMAAHMFCLFYACLSNITPPVAISAYVAGGIAGSDRTKTALLAVKLGLVGFLLPLFFLRNPALLWGVTGVPAWRAATAALTAAMGCGALSAALFWRSDGDRRAAERAFLLAGALCLLDPNLATDWIGLALCACAMMIYHKRKGKKT